MACSSAIFLFRRQLQCIVGWVQLSEVRICVHVPVCVCLCVCVYSNASSCQRIRPAGTHVRSSRAHTHTHTQSTWVVLSEIIVLSVCFLAEGMDQVCPKHRLVRVCECIHNQTRAQTQQHTMLILIEVASPTLSKHVKHNIISTQAVSVSVRTRYLLSWYAFPAGPT
jgi:hypothetical protein